MWGIHILITVVVKIQMIQFQILMCKLYVSVIISFVKVQKAFQRTFKKDAWIDVKSTQNSWLGQVQFYGWYNKLLS